MSGYTLEHLTVVTCHMLDAHWRAEKLCAELPFPRRRLIGMLERMRGGAMMAATNARTTR